MAKRLFVVDVSSYIYRAYHALVPLSNSKGLPTHAILGVTNMLLKMMREKKPDFMIVAFDSKGPTFRHKESPTYKANRPLMPEDLVKQIPYIKRVVDALGIPILEVEGYEADDIIATICQGLKGKDIEVTIVSGDKDLRQLVSERITVWDSMLDHTITKEEIKKRYGLNPERLYEVMALIGDKIDNIPGVPGVGEKTAVRLINQFGSLEGIFNNNNIDKVEPKHIRESLIKNRDQVILNLKLIKLKKDVPIAINLEELERRPQNVEDLRNLFEELEFRRLLRDVLPYQNADKLDYCLILSEDELNRLSYSLKKVRVFSLNIMTTDELPMRAKIVGISICHRVGQGFYIPIAHDYLGAPSQIPLSQVLNILAPVLEDEGIDKLGHNIKQDYVVLAQHGIKLKGIKFDTMIASYVINPEKTDHSLEELAQEYLRIKKKKYKDIAGKKKIPLSHLKVDVVKDYTCENAEIVFRLKDILSEKIKQLDQEFLFYKIEMPLINVLAIMEMWGVKVDVPYLRKLAEEFSLRLRSLEKKIFSLAGEAFNINSPAQLRYILFEKLKLPYGKKTKTGYSTDAEVLQELAAIHPLAGEVLGYRILSKLKNTYIDALPKLIHPETGRIHTVYNQAITSTGRLSSSEPNLQNIPVKGKDGKGIRRAFIPEPGCVYLSADYSQIELRLLAHFSKDESLIKAFIKGEDIHRRTASQIFQVPLDLISEQMRRQAKTINFGIIYGMSPYGLARELNIDTSMAKAYIEQYFEQYKGVKAYIENTLRQVHERKQVETLFKHIRKIPNINSSNFTLRKLSERMAINTPIQGTGAEVIKLAMIRITDALSFLKSKMIIQVHDELVFEVPIEELEKVKALVKDIMENIVTLAVPLVVDIKTGPNWGEVQLVS